MSNKKHLDSDIEGFSHPLPIVVARSSDESAILEGTASQANSEGSIPWGK